jgi:hypothetical protein
MMSLTLRKRQLCIKTAKQAPHIKEKSTIVRILDRFFENHFDHWPILPPGIHRPIGRQIRVNIDFHEDRSTLRLCFVTKSMGQLDEKNFDFRGCSSPDQLHWLGSGTNRFDRLQLGPAHTRSVDVTKRMVRRPGVQNL